MTYITGGKTPLTLKFIFIYLLHVLFILVIGGIFEKRKVCSKELKRVIFLVSKFC